MRAINAVPSEPRIACGVSTWISNFSLLDRGHLRQGDDEAVGDRSEVLHEEVEGPDTATSGWRFQRFDPQTVVRGLAGKRLSSSDRCRVLFVVRPVAVAVLEVDAEILDRFTVEFRAHPVVHLVRQFGRQVQHLREFRRGPAVLVERRTRPRTPVGDGARVVLIGRNVDSVDRLPDTPIAAVVRGQRRVRGRQPPVQLGHQVVHVMRVIQAHAAASSAFRIVETNIYFVEDTSIRASGIWR
jgi:hypothetical protein